MRTLLLFTSSLVAAPAALLAGEKNMMHCFAFTAVETATQGDWDTWFKANDAMPSKMKGIVKRVWFGKLRSVLNTWGIDAESSKKLRAGEKSVQGDITYRPRQWGMCMELEGLDNLKSYADHPFHKEWETAYFKIRVAGTTTYDILGQ